MLQPWPQKFKTSGSDLQQLIAKNNSTFLLHQEEEKSDLVLLVALVRT